MKITLFGATGRIGSIILRRALEQGYEVNAYVRREIDTKHPNLTCYLGELTDEAKIRSAIRGTDAVISALGEYRQLDIIPPAYARILRIMQEESVDRFINIMTPTSVQSKKDRFCFTTWFPKLMVRIIDPKESRIGGQTVGKMIVESPLRWTIVRMVNPYDGPYTGNVNVGFGKNFWEFDKKRIKIKISREDVAQYMLDQVEDETYIRDMPIIGSF